MAQQSGKNSTCIHVSLLLEVGQGYYNWTSAVQQSLKWIFRASEEYGNTGQLKRQLAVRTTFPRPNTSQGRAPTPHTIEPPIEVFRVLELCFSRWFLFSQMCLSQKSGMVLWLLEALWPVLKAQGHLYCSWTYSPNNYKRSAGGISFAVSLGIQFLHYMHVTNCEFKRIPWSSLLISTSMNWCRWHHVLFALRAAPLWVAYLLTSQLYHRPNFPLSSIG